MSTSVGPRGAKLTVGTHGVRSTVGIPGTGIYYTSQAGAVRRSQARRASRQAVAPRGGLTGTQRAELQRRAVALAADVRLPSADRKWIGWGIGIGAFGVLALLGQGWSTAAVLILVGAGCVGIGILLDKRPRWQAIRSVRAARRLDDPVEADQLLHQALAIDPNCAPALFDEAQDFYERGSYGAAATMFTKYLGLAPAHLYARWQLADALVRDHQPDAALAVLLQLRGHLYYDESGQAAITSKMAWAFIEKAEYTQAVELANTAIGQKRNLLPGQLDCLYARAVALSRLGQRARAIRDLDRLCAIDPFYPNLQQFRESLLVRAVPGDTGGPARPALGQCDNCGGPGDAGSVCRFCGHPIGLAAVGARS